MPDRISFNLTSKCIRVWAGGSGRDGKQKYFSFAHRPLENALQDAIKYESLLPVRVRMGKKKPQPSASKHSQSGIVGISPFKNRSGNHAGWRAQWIDHKEDPPKKRCKDFSFYRHGDSALELAKQFRKEQVRKCYLMLEQGFK